MIPSDRVAPRRLETTRCRIDWFQVLVCSEGTPDIAFLVRRALDFRGLRDVVGERVRDSKLIVSIGLEPGVLRDLVRTPSGL